MLRKEGGCWGEQGREGEEKRKGGERIQERHISDALAERNTEGEKGEGIRERAMKDDFNDDLVKR